MMERTAVFAATTTGVFDWTPNYGQAGQYTPDLRLSGMVTLTVSW